MTPLNAIGALRAWVEQGKAPDTLPSVSQYPINASSSYAVNGTNVRTVDLCPYPMVEKYKGDGEDPAVATSWECSADADGWERFPGPSASNFAGCVGGPGWYG